MLTHQEICRKILTSATIQDGRIKTLRGAVRWFLRTGQRLDGFIGYNQRPERFSPLDGHSTRFGPIWLGAWLQYAGRIEDLIGRGYSPEQARKIARAASGSERCVFVESSTPPDVDTSSTQCYGHDEIQSRETGIPVESIRRWTQWVKETKNAKPSRLSKRMARWVAVCEKARRKCIEKSVIAGKTDTLGLAPSVLANMAGLSEDTPLPIIADKLADMGMDDASNRARLLAC